MIQQVDNYCERLDGAFWAEPLNALTNLAFFIAALAAWALAKKYTPGGARPLILAAWLAVIGTGSFLFHTLATLWAMFADSIPILIYQLMFIYFYARGVMRFPRRDAGALLGMFVVSVFLFGQLPSGLLNGSVSYAPALLFLFGLALWHRKNAAREKNILLLASALFLVSLTFRSLDMALCPSFPPGLHFLWHLLNGIVLYLSARSYILNISPARQ